MKKPSDIFVALWVVLFCGVTITIRILILAPVAILAVLVVGSYMLFAFIGGLFDWITEKEALEALETTKEVE